MFSFPIFLLAGPCLMALTAAIALFIVHRSLSRVTHALVWSGAFALASVRWGFAALLWRAPLLDPGGVMLFDLLGLLAILLFAQGFRLRSGVARRVPMVTACLAVPALLVLAAFPPTPLRAALVPAVSLGLLVWSATIVVPRTRHASPAEIAVIGMLCTLAAVHLTAIATAAAEQAGLVRSHFPFLAIYAVTLAPANAACGLFSLLLICFDFSAEQHRLVHTDPLTGVLNRLGLDRLAHRAIRRSLRRARPLSLAIVDIDGFKAINDRAGHAGGDATLVSFAQHLAGELSREEAVARIGGEEFVLLLPGCDGPAALAKVEPIRAGLSTLAVPDVPGLKVTASFGVAEHDPQAPLSETIARADAALYRAKRQGRDRSTLAAIPC